MSLGLYWNRKTVGVFAAAVGVHFHEHRTVFTILPRVVFTTSAQKIRVSYTGRKLSKIALVFSHLATLWGPRCNDQEIDAS